MKLELDKDEVWEILEALEVAMRLRLHSVTKQASDRVDMIYALQQKIIHQATTKRPSPYNL